MWRSIDIPIRLVNEETVAGKEPYVRKYISISVPTVKYEGYHFLFPSQLVFKENDRATLSIPPDFEFTFIKRDRGEGKRYKRFKLSHQEFLELYKPYEMELIEADHKNRNEINQTKGRLVLAKYPYYLGRLKQGSNITIGLIIDKWFYPKKYEDYLSGRTARKQISAA